MQKRERLGKQPPQLDLLPSGGAEQPPAQLPADALTQARKRLQELLLEVIDAKRAGLEDADE